MNLILKIVRILFIEKAQWKDSGYCLQRWHNTGGQRKPFLAIVTLRGWGLSWCQSRKPHCISQRHGLCYFKSVFIDFWREEKIEISTIRQKHRFPAYRTSPTGDWASNPGMCPDKEWNWWPIGAWNKARSRGPYWLGYTIFLIESSCLKLYVLKLLRRGSKGHHQGWKAPKLSNLKKSYSCH